MEKRVLIITFEGDEVDKFTQSKVVEALLASDVPIKSETASIHGLNEAEIMATLATKVMPAEDVPAQEMSPEDAAAIYIGEKFSNGIQDTSKFSAALASSYILACVRNNDDKLIKSVQILGENGVTASCISHSVRMKYNIYQQQIDVINEIYHTVCAGHIR